MTSNRFWWRKKKTKKVAAVNRSRISICVTKIFDPVEIRFSPPVKFVRSKSNCTGAGTGPKMGVLGTRPLARGRGVADH